MLCACCYHCSMLSVFYILVRALSFGLRNYSAAHELIGALLVGSFLFLCIKNISLAWRILVLELLLDGAGHFFEFHSLLVRTWVLGIFACVWMWKKFRAHERKKNFLFLPQKNSLIALALFGIFLAWAAANGVMHGNDHRQIAQDTILYLFLALLFPALEFEHFPKKLYTRAIKIFIFGSALFSLLTLALYSSKIFVLTDPYYHWFRNVAAGKITDLGSHFFRIVLPEQILFVPIILVLLGCLIKKFDNKKIWTLMACSLVSLTLNFTRMYFIALAVGALVLLYRTSWKRWLAVAATTFTLAALIFFSLHFIASRGQTIGLELLGIRVAGIHAPETDPSGAIRIALLPDIFRHIKMHPLLGSGLGTKISYLDPTTHTAQTRTQFDWGYFEMITELGALGTVAYIALLGTITYNFARITRAHEPYAHIARGFLAGAVALCIINITTPALFQGFGVLYFVFLLVISFRMRECSPQNESNPTLHHFFSDTSP